MRRKLTLLAAIPMLLMGLSSCSQEEDFAPQEQEICIATRSTSDEEYYTYTASVDESGTPTWTLDEKFYRDGYKQEETPGGVSLLL